MQQASKDVTTRRFPNQMYLVPALPSDVTSFKSAVVFFSLCIILHINSEHMIALNIISTKYFNVSRYLMYLFNIVYFIHIILH